MVLNFQVSRRAGYYTYRGSLSVSPSIRARSQRPSQPSRAQEAPPVYFNYDERASDIHTLTHTVSPAAFLTRFITASPSRVSSIPSTKITSTSS